MSGAIAVILLSLCSAQDADKDASKDPNVRRISVDYDQVLLETILADLQKRTGIPIEMDERARKEIDPSKEKISMKAQDLTVTAILSLMVRPRSPVVTLRFIDNKKLLITTKP